MIRLVSRFFYLQASHRFCTASDCLHTLVKKKQKKLYSFITKKLEWMYDVWGTMNFIIQLQDKITVALM